LKKTALFSFNLGAYVPEIFKLALVSQFQKMGSKYLWICVIIFTLHNVLAICSFYVIFESKVFTETFLPF
jgi:hypothetical protein